jgi:LmbE family N-acetylglucosaminyl deacetylase
MKAVGTGKDHPLIAEWEWGRNKNTKWSGIKNQGSVDHANSSQRKTGIRRMTLDFEPRGKAPFMENSSWKETFIPLQEGLSLDDFHGRSGNLVVISPHPDDDVLGAGGTMIEAAEKGRGVFSVTVTDGRGSPRKGPAISDEEMVERRQKESMAALKVVGAAGGFYFKRRSSDLEGEGGKEVVKDLKGLIEWLTPAEVYLPAPYERHKTHQRVTRLTIEALRLSTASNPFLFGYNLWGGFFGEKKRCLRDISPFIRKKVESVLAHSTQIAYKNYQQGILGRNNADAIFWESHDIQRASFVETFLDMTELLERKNVSLDNFIREDVETFIRAFL